MSLIDSLLQPALIDDALIELRRHAHTCLQSTGLPSARDEDWRYSSLRTLAGKSFALRDDAREPIIAAAVDARLAAAGLRLVFVNGELRADLSAFERLPPGIRVVFGVPAPTLATIPPLAPFLAANLALAQSGAELIIDDEVTLETFFAEAPRLNPNASLITGVICGYKVQDIEDPLMQKIRYLDKLVDELAKGKKMEKILRRPAGSPA